MAIKEHVTRRLAGFDEVTGEQIWYTTWHGRPAPPESLAEWVQIRRARIGSAAQTPGGQIVVAMLTADGDAAVDAAVAAGRSLDGWQRHAVTETLQACQAAAPEYAPAIAFMARLLAAWTARWGDKKPRPVPLPGTGTARGAGRRRARALAGA